MNRVLLMIFTLLLFSSCKQNKAKTSPKLVSQLAVNPSHASNTAIYDSTITLFGDTSYKLKLHVIDRESYDETNAVLTLQKNRDGKVKMLFRDSIYTRNGGYMQFEDFNNDKIKDLMVFYNDGARANPRYHLYLVDPKRHELMRVKGFEELPNPELDTINNIITSLALSGSDYYSFYRITPKNKLINLGHSFEVSEGHPDENDYDKKYEKAMKRIKKENRGN